MPTISWNDERAFFAFHSGTKEHPAAEKAAAEERPPVVFIHGAGGSHLDWPPALRRLPGRSVYALDLPGHGRTGGAGLSSVEAYSHWVSALWDAAGWPPAVLIGHSMGAAIALTLALRSSSASAGPHAGRVLGAVLIGGGARLPVSPRLLKELQEEPSRALALIADWAYGPAATAEMKKLSLERLALVEPAVLRADFHACAAFDMRRELAHITTPTLIICGAEDRLTPPAYSQDLHEHVRASQLLVLEGAGHLVTFERPDVVAGAIVRFLDSVEAELSDRLPSALPHAM